MSINVNVGNIIPSNVVEVGNEISVNQLAAITAATDPSATNPFSTAGHTHIIANVTGLQTALDGKAGTAHTHAISDVTSLSNELASKAGVSHLHTLGEVTGLPAALADKAPLVHTHVIADTTGLQTALDGKSATTHLHTGVYAPATHSHAIADTTGLQTALDGKALVAHTHAIADTTGLQTALDGKSATTHLHTGVYAPVTHTHAIADVTGLQTELDSKVSGSGYALLTGATFSGEIATPQIGNLLNTDLVIDAYNDTGAGTHYYHKFAPNGGLVLAPNGGYLQVGFSGSIYQLTSNGLATSWTTEGDIGRSLVLSQSGLTWDNASTFNYSLANSGSFVFNDKVTLAAPTAQKASLNLGVGVAPTSAVAGDIWLGANINYKSSDGVTKAVANTNTTNTFTQPQIIGNSGASAALRITQLGTGEALRVEDSTTPDTTSFIVANDGKVGIGINAGTALSSDLEIIKRSGSSHALNITGTSGLAVLITGSSYTPALQVNFGYIQSEGGFKINTTGGVLSRLLTPVAGTGTYDKEIQVTINGTDYRIPCRLG